MASSLEDIGRPPRTDPDRWVLELEDVPETVLHDVIIELLKLVLKYHYRDRDAVVTSNVACRWAPDDQRLGVNPDIILLEPAPPEGIGLKSLCVWKPGHSPPKLAIEIVSETNAAKDYVDGPPRLGRLGAEEVWIFDPGRYGPTDNGGPFVLQIWRRSASRPDHMEPVHQGDTPGYSPVLDGWAVAVEGKGGLRLRVAADAEGTKLWPTRDEAEAEARRAEAEARRAEAEGRRAEAEARRAETIRADAEAEARRLADARAAAAEAEVRRLRALLDQSPNSD